MLAQDKRLIRKLTQRYGFPIEPRVIAVDEHDDAVRSVRNHDDARIIPDICKDGDLGFEVDDVAKGAFRVSKQRGNLHVRMLAFESGKYLGRMKRPHRRKPQMAFRRQAVACQQLVGLIAEFHDAACNLEQGRAGRRQFDPPRSADQELDAIGRLEIPDLNGQGRLANIQDARGRGKAAMLGNRMESPKLAEYY